MSDGSDRPVPAFPAATQGAADMPASGCVDAAAFRRTLSRWATGVAVVTTTDVDGAPVGITVNSLSSVSLDPPLVLWSIDHRASCLPAFRAASAFAVNLLPAGAAGLCRRFSRREPDRFAGVPHESGPLGMPLLHDVLGHLCCRVWARYPGGDHEIMVGEVVHARCWDGDPLVFHQGRLLRLGGMPAPQD